MIALTSKEENRLAGASSPYLQSAAHQPVAWYPWGEEAFRRAKELDRPLLLDIGAAWCHWCHVIDKESYEDEETARIINENFVAVKVDRDERPDLDSRYQEAVGAITGQGGWPLTAFLTPEGKVFYGGTYFPPDDRYGLLSFKKVLLGVADFYCRERQKALEEAEKLHQALAREERQSSRQRSLDTGLIEEGLNSIVSLCDVEWGGFGTAPKFFHPGAIEFLISRYLRTGDKRLKLIVERTLVKMGRGGVYDQLGGGFHRYSTDRRWVLPHFEKMLYDNAELLKNYVHAWQVTGNPFLKEVALGIINYVDGTLLDRERGGFYASQDADIGMHDDGDYYTWTVDELRDAILDEEEFKVLRLYYNVHPQGEMRESPAKKVLYIDEEPEEIARELGVTVERVGQLIESGKGRLLEARGKRKAPFVDKTIYSSWNGMMATAYLEAYEAMGIEACRDSALKTLDLVMKRLYHPEHGLYHALSEGKPKIRGLLDDQVQVANSLLEAFQVTQDLKYLRYAERLMKFTLDHFWDELRGGFFGTAGDVYDSGGLPSLEVRQRPIVETPSPSPNALAALILDRLYKVTGNEEYRAKAEETLMAFAPKYAKEGLYAGTLLLALESHLLGSPQALIVGEPSNLKAQRLFAAAISTYSPGKVVLLQSTVEALGYASPPFQEALRRSGEIAAYICLGRSCFPPTDDPGRIMAILSYRA